ncbi:outer membrane beta-barrel protein [Mucilaginibacter litoreus]|uniref:Outer membrane beta-barrel protein n=1 Tax=Mucilaginibacter litoreus TaxID=1048221 RepID=A0ABW3AW48_9SPHI
MKKFLTIAVIILLGGAVQSNAQSFKMGLGIEGALPVGTFKEAYNFGGGLTLRAGFGIKPTGMVTLTAGAIGFIPKDLESDYEDIQAQLNIPIKAGYKYMVTPHFYVIGEAGVTIIKTFYEDGEEEGIGSGSTSKFTYAPGIGVKFGAIDLSARYEGYDHGGFMGLRLGFGL